MTCCKATLLVFTFRVDNCMHALTTSSPCLLKTVSFPPTCIFETRAYQIANLLASIGQQSVALSCLVLPFHFFLERARVHRSNGQTNDPEKWDCVFLAGVGRDGCEMGRE